MKCLINLKSQLSDACHRKYERTRLQSERHGAVKRVTDTEDDLYCLSRMLSPSVRIAGTAAIVRTYTLPSSLLTFVIGLLFFHRFTGDTLQVYSAMPEWCTREQPGSLAWVLSCLSASLRSPLRQTNKSRSTKMLSGNSMR